MDPNDISNPLNPVSPLSPINPLSPLNPNGIYAQDSARMESTTPSRPMSEADKKATALFTVTMLAIIFGMFVWMVGCELVDHIRSRRYWR